MIKLNVQENQDIKKINLFNQKKYNKLAIFSHFDKNNKIDKYVIYMLNQLHKLKFDIIFVTTSEQIHQNELKKIDYTNIDELCENNMALLKR